MAKFLFKVCVMVYFVCHVFGTIAAAQDECHAVRTEFQNRRIGQPELVPREPVHDENLLVCTSGIKDPATKSCCTAETEKKYVTASEKFLKDNIQRKNAYIKKLVMDHIAKYEGDVVRSIQESQTTTESILTDVYKIPRTEHVFIVQEFFGEIQKYIKHKEVSMYASVSLFFNQLFPKVIKYSIHHEKVTDFSELQLNCLREKRPQILPSPFGFAVNNISHSLKEVMDVSRTYMEVLSLIVEAINTTDHLVVSQKCREQTTQLQYCSHCGGHIDIKPCKGFCLNVMHQCLAQLSTLTSEWEALLQYVVQPSGGSRALEIEDLLKVLDRHIDRAVMHAVNNAYLFSKSVRDECGVVLNTLPPSDSTPLNDIYGGHPVTKGIHVKDFDFYGELIDSVKMFDTISKDICVQELFYDQDIISDKCWNGTTVGRYTAMVEPISVFLDARDTIQDPKILDLREKLKTMKKNLITKYADQSERMFSDDRRPLYSSFSGDGALEFGTFDDEDLDDEGSGSGDSGNPGYTIETSGDKSDEVDKEKTATEILTRKPEVVPPNRVTTPRPSSAPTVSATITTLLSVMSVILML